MNKYNIFFLMAGAALAILFMKSCVGNDEKGIPKPSRTIVTIHDTIRPSPEKVTLYIKVPQKTKEVPVLIYDSSACKFNRIYSDSVVDTNLTMYYTDSINGRLLDKKMSYKLKVPVKIITTTTIIDSIPYAVNMPKNSIYLSGELGISKSSYNVSVGADFLSRKKWGAGYRFGINDKSHNVAFKWKLY